MLKATQAQLDAAQALQKELVKINFELVRIQSQLEELKTSRQRDYEVSMRYMMKILKGASAVLEDKEMSPLKL